MGAVISGTGVAWDGSSWFHDTDGIDAITGFETFGTYAEWAQQVIGNADADADPDADGMLNRLEYYLGGNPNLDDAGTVLPANSLSGDVLEYVYNRRRDAALRGLAYDLKETDSLTNGWNTVDYEAGSDAVDLYYESVTNEIPTTGSQGFYKLEISDIE